MARVVNTYRVDDIDGSPATERITFALDGSRFTIDVNTDHAAALRDLFAPYIAAGRRTHPRPRVAGRVATATAPAAHPARRSTATPRTAPTGTTGASVVVLPSAHRGPATGSRPVDTPIRRLLLDLLRLARELATAGLASALEWLVRLVARLQASLQPVGARAGSAQNATGRGATPKPKPTIVPAV